MPTGNAGTSAYWRGTPPQAGGTGSGAGPAGGPLARNGNGWTPTVVNLLVLIGLEIVAYVALRWTFRTVHGG